MKISIQIVTVALAASAAAHPQNGRKPAPSSTTAGSATSSTAVPSKGSMFNLPFMPTWFFRDSSQNKCISAYNACLISKSSDQSPCASDYATCIKSAASASPSGGSATSSKPPPPPSATGSKTASGTMSRPPRPTSLKQWWGQEQGRRKCRYDHYMCISNKSNNKADCDDKRASCFASAKTASATTGPTSIPTGSATTTDTGSTSAAATTSSTTVADAVAATASTDASLSPDDPSFGDDSDDST